MALTITNVGTNNSTSSSATLTLGSVTADVGDWLVVMVGADNNGTSGAASLSTTMTDDASGGGNTYTNRGGVINQDPGSAAAGVSFSMWTAEITNALSGGTITANFSPNTASKAILAYRVQPGAGESVTFSLVDTGGTGSATTHTAGTAGTDAGQTVFGGSAVETNTTVTGDADTLDGAWSTQLSAIANTGTDLTSITLTAQWKTATTLNFQNRGSTTAAAKDYACNSLVLGFLAAATARRPLVNVGHAVMRASVY